MKAIGVRDKSPIQIQLKHTLHGHTSPVTCLATSSSYNIIVSGSKVSSTGWGLVVLIGYFRL